MQEPCRRNIFSQIMANDWNALPDAVVISGSINQFKGRLGRWWKNDPILYQNIRSPQVKVRSHELVLSDVLCRRQNWENVQTSDVRPRYVNLI